MIPAGSQSPQCTWQANTPVLTSALLPGKPLMAPAAARVAVVVLVQFAFEAVLHVGDAPEAGALELLAGFLRAIARAAEGHDGALGMACARELLHRAVVARIHRPVRAVVPRHVQRALRVADEQIFHLAAAVDEQRIRIALEEFERVARRQVVHRSDYKCLTLKEVMGKIPPPLQDAPI